MESPIGNSVYEAIELVGTSTKSWEDAVKTAMETADKKLTNMRIAEVVKLDTNLADGGVMSTGPRSGSPSSMKSSLRRSDSILDSILE
jgi:flavin-binding protein dodecin